MFLLAPAQLPAFVVVMLQVLFDNLNMVNRHDRVYNPGLAVSTGLSLKKTPRQIEKQNVERAAALGGAYRAALGVKDRKAIAELAVAYFNNEELSEGSILIVGEAAGSLFTQFKGLESIIVALGGLRRSLPRGFEELSDKEMQVVNRETKRLRRAHRKFHAAVTWLCSAKNPDQVVFSRDITKRWVRRPEVDRETEGFVRYFEDHGLNHFRFQISLQYGCLLLFPSCRDSIDPFCAFLLQECEGKRAEEMPVKLCPRCKRLFFAQGAKKFCSSTCHDKAYWTRERGADYAYVGRFENYSPSELQKRFKEEKVQNRLHEIQARWPAWQTINDKIQALRRVLTREDRACEGRCGS